MFSKGHESSGQCFLRLIIALLLLLPLLIGVVLWIMSNGHIISGNWSYILNPIYALISALLGVLAFFFPLSPISFQRFRKVSSNTPTPSTPATSNPPTTPITTHPSASAIKIDFSSVSSSPAVALTWSKDGKRILFRNSDGLTKILNGQNLTELSSFLNDSTPIEDSIILSDGRFASVSTDGTMQIFDPITKQRKITTFHDYPIPVKAVKLSPDGESIALVNSNDFVELRDSATGRSVLILPGSARTHAVAWSPEGKRIATGNEFGHIDIWDASSAKNILHIPNDNPVFDLSWKPGGREIVSIHARGLMIWDAYTGKHKETNLSNHIPQAKVLAWSPNGKYFATASPPPDTTVQVRDDITGQLIITYRGHTKPVLVLDWSPDSTQVASASADLTVQVWKAV